MHTLKKFGFGAVAAALFAVMALATLVNTAYADVTGFTAGDDTIVAGQTTTLTATVTDLTDQDTVTFTLANTDGDFGLGDDEDNEVECVVTVSAAADELDCDDGVASVAEDVLDGDEAAGPTSLTITLHANSAGETDIIALQEETDGTDIGVASESVEAFGTVTTADAFDIDAPVSIEEDTIFSAEVVDNDGDEVTSEDIEVEVEGVGGDVDITCSATEGGTYTAASCTDDSISGEIFITVADIESGTTAAEFTFYTGAGAFTDVVETITIPVAGDAESIEITVAETVAPGATAPVVVMALDADGNFVVGVQIDVTASAGSLVGCVDESTDEDGEVTCTFVAPNTAQTVQITAVSEDDDVDVASVAITSTTDPDDGETGDGTLASDTVFNAQGVGDNVFNGGTIEQLAAAVAADGGSTVWLSHPVTGAYVVYNITATGAAAGIVNGPFMTAFADGIDGPKAVFIVE